MTDDLILELSALAPKRPKARLRHKGDPEGTVYELAVPDDFGAVTLSRLGQMIDEADELWAKDLDEPEERRLEDLLNKITGNLIREAPEDAISALPAIQKRILSVRFLADARQKSLDILAGTTIDRPTGESSSLDSNGSSEGTP